MSQKKPSTKSNKSLSRERKKSSSHSSLRKKIHGDLLRFLGNQTKVAPNKMTTGNLEEQMPKETAQITPAGNEAHLVQNEKEQPVKEEHQIKNEREKRIADIVAKGEIVGSVFQIVAKLKDGGFGQVYKAVNNNNQEEVALKVERIVSNVDNIEAHVLRAFQGHVNCPILYAAGTSGDFVFIAMQLLDDNLSDIRRSCPLTPPKLSMSSAYRSAMQCLKAIEDLHSVGYLHRDIKPSNLTVGKQAAQRRIVYLVDFGLCRRFMSHDGVIKKPRENVGFRGTVRYASMAAHDRKELSRRDDLWSLFYSLIELLTGQLPWRKTNDKEIVAKMKRKYSPDILCQVFPTEVGEFVRHVAKLDFDEKPNYHYLNECLAKIVQQIGAKMEDPYDWQMKDCRVLRHWKLSSRSK